MKLTFEIIKKIKIIYFKKINKKFNKYIKDKKLETNVLKNTKNY